ncbi:unnamed protein product [Dovyalis caffra]|uniref:Uncharacterized protein n=1 Tax=Dovyalis caffra TaxID=77055 RepID=A0AAV1RWS7_9ROSI|nr:unnamed protein product [Dovyalis caffra]
METYTVFKISRFYGGGRISSTVLNRMGKLEGFTIYDGRFGWAITDIAPTPNKIIMG